MVEDDGKVEGEVDLGPLHALMAIPELERDQWCIDVVNSIADAVEGIAQMKGKIKQAKALKAFLKDLRAKRDEILPVVYYMIKPRFRDAIQTLMERFSGYVGGGEGTGKE